MRIRLSVDADAPEGGKCILEQHSLGGVPSSVAPQIEDGLLITHGGIT